MKAIRRAGRSGASFRWTNGTSCPSPLPGCSKHATFGVAVRLPVATEGRENKTRTGNAASTQASHWRGTSLLMDIMTTGTVFRKVCRFTIVSCALIPLRRDFCWRPRHPVKMGSSAQLVDRPFGRVQSHDEL
ncbi:hypothetical protein CDAR_294611 [Caerostris darwini]|uniref:Uncharacterized protein n=1 Tax=Caerostris darwini TaxID=1538125 RepID=A0AAV4UKH0_9ARAC|nr:hypothetical protein CDAR_294611 [Caerostris darwini]